MELCKTDLFKLASKIFPTRISIQEIKNIFGQALDALDYLHKKNICHFDIKPDNIFIHKMKRGEIKNQFHSFKIKIGDFGFAHSIDDLDEK